MVRCKICKNRFIEKNLYERHLRDRHYTEYLAYLIQQEEEIAEQRFLNFEDFWLITLLSNAWLIEIVNRDLQKSGFFNFVENFRQAELEANRIEELATGGYIPPEHEIDAESYEVEVDK